MSAQLRMINYCLYPLRLSTSMRLGALLVVAAYALMANNAHAQVFITDTQVQNGGVFDVNPPDGEAVVISYTGTDASLSLTNGATTNGIHGVVVGLESGEQGTLLINQGSVLSNLEPWWTNSWTFAGYNFFAGQAGIGVGAGSYGTATVTGPGSAWNNSGALSVGFLGTGVLNVLDSGNVTSDSGYLGFGTNSSGTVSISGSGSNWSISDTLYVGFDGTGELNISNGGSVLSHWGILGFQNDGVGSVTVNGLGSNWTMTGELHLGYWPPGSGTMTIEAGGSVQNSVGYISNGSSALITGSGSNWSNSGDLYVGYNSGELTIADGGSVSNAAGVIGFGGAGTATVTGSGSTWVNSGNLYVGYNNSGDLIISNGGSVSNADGYVGAFGTVATVTVTGSGSTWSNSGTLTVGAQMGAGTLIIEGGASVSSDVGFIDYGGSLSIDGTDSNWTTTGDLYVGFWSAGELHLNNGAFVDVGGTLYTYSFGTLTGNGGTILGNVENSGLLAPGNSTGILTIDGNFDNWGVLDIQLGGLLAGTGYDQLIVTGDVTLSGGGNRLLVSTWGGFLLGTNQSFDIMTFNGSLTGYFHDEFYNDLYEGSLVGNFNGVDLFISYHSGGVRLYSAIPEPSSLLLVGLGLVANISRRSKRRHNTNLK